MSDSKSSQTTAPVSAQASPLPRPVTMWLGMMVVAPLASVVCAYGHWLVVEVTVVFALTMLVVAVPAGLLTWRKGSKGSNRNNGRDLRGLTSIALPSVLWILPVAVHYQAWGREHDAFHSMVKEIIYIQRDQKGCMGIAQHPHIAPYTSLIRGLSFEPNRVVWRYSSQGEHVYDCVERKVSDY